MKLDSNYFRFERDCEPYKWTNLKVSLSNLYQTAVACYKTVYHIITMQFPRINKFIVMGLGKQMTVNEKGTAGIVLRIMLIVAALLRFSRNIG